MVTSLLPRAPAPLTQPSSTTPTSPASAKHLHNRKERDCRTRTVASNQLQNRENQLRRPNIHPAPPGTALRYGNMEVEHIEQISTIGTYQAQLFPDRHSTALVSTQDIITRGHVITFTDHRCIIEDAAGQYALRLPRIPVSREWRYYLPCPIHNSRPTRTPQPAARSPQPAARSARLHLLPPSTIRRVMRLHKRMGHPLEDIMVQAVTSTWRHTAASSTRNPAYPSCILAKRNRDNPNIWKGRQNPTLTPLRQPPPFPPKTKTPRPTHWKKIVPPGY